ncbi:hypothetical protein J7W50_004290 [Salmonella enterica]|nr:hypothetical protein [Salmonella enterica subsp. enterica serovar Enteritidis]EEO8344833.1 hypothetical protein [Salmonella enterica]HCM1918924.1 hypothetical protein [Salmonella enterica subsp. salamae serovar 28:r:e,n,z15]EHC7607571.1 hypothetical protein [Salmonella enterica]EHC7690689.1 hypothetical protein [Salmonella enterica]
MSQPNPLCVGIDVSEATLGITATNEVVQFTFRNDTDGFDSNVAELKNIMSPWF